MERSPEVSVITATHNDSPYLSEAIQSILNQTFSDFEYIIIDDASTDRVPQILAQYASKDSRIIVCQNEQKLGRSRSRNRGLSMAKGRWVAIFDGDDISHPRRLEKQVKYLKEHPETDYIGSGCYYISKQTGEDMVDREFQPKLSHGEICWDLCFTFPFHHSSTIGKRELFIEAGGYPADFPVCEDISLWMQMVKEGACFGNIPDKLITYRVNTKPQYYALNHILAQELHRKHISSILQREITQDLFKLIWQTSTPGLTMPPPIGYMSVVEAVDVLMNLYEILSTQNVFDTNTHVNVRLDIVQRIKTLVLIDPTAANHPGWTYQYTYQLPTSRTSP